MKKKIIAMSLALVVIAGVGKGIVASAAVVKYDDNTTGKWTETPEDDTINNNGTDMSASVTSEKTVTITSAQSATVYSVDITWPDLTISEGAATWQPSNHTYTGGGSSWGSTYDSDSIVNEATITVANHSNASVYSKCEFAETYSRDTYKNSDLTVTVDSDSFNELLSAAGKSANGTIDYYGDGTKFDSNTHKLTVAGSLKSTSASTSVDVGTATITLKNRDS